MKKRLMVVWCLMLASYPVLATNTVEQTNPSLTTSAQADTKVFSSEERRQAQVQLRALAAAFGVETPASTSVQVEKNNAPSAGNKTMAEVADKALDMVTQLVGSISATLEKVSPEIWRIFVRQQYAKAISELVVPWGMVILLLIFSGIVRKSWKYNLEEKIFRENFDESGPFTNRGWRGVCSITIPYILGFVFLIWGCNRLADAVPLLFNPQYYAVQDLLRMLLNPGSM